MKNQLRITLAVFLAALIIAAGNTVSSGNYSSAQVVYEQEVDPQDGGDGPKRPRPTPTTKPLIEVELEAGASASVQVDSGGGLLSEMWDWMTGWF